MKRKIATAAILALGGVAATAHALTNFYVVAPVLTQEASNGGVISNPTLLRFGSVTVGASKQLSVAIRNPTQGTVSIQTVTTEGVYQVAGHSCPATLKSGGSCSVQVEFTPNQNYGGDGSLVINGNSIATLNGIPAYARLAANAMVDFGTATHGDRLEKTLVIQNKGNLMTELSYSDLPDTVEQLGDCTQVAAGQQCRITLIYEPTDGHRLNGSLRISGSHNEISVGLKGVAPKQARLEGESAQVFKTLVIGSSSTVTWTLHNTGELPKAMSYSELPKELVRTGTCESKLDGGALCTVTLTWTPSAAGTLSHTLNVAGQRLEMSGTALAAFEFNQTLTSQANYNLKTAARAAGWDGVSPLSANIVVPSGVTVGATDTAIGAIQIDELPEYSQLEITNYGSIFGMGGAGGNGGIYGSSNYEVMRGKPGGPAVAVHHPSKITNYGIIAGGGGGGAGSPTENQQNVLAGGAGGGGGQGYGTSAGGARSHTNDGTGYIYPYASSGANGSINGPGAGGNGVGSNAYPRVSRTPYLRISGKGGTGGTWGMPGSKPSPGLYVPSNTYLPVVSEGGAAGLAVYATKHVTWGSRGTLYGEAPL